MQHRLNHLGQPIGDPLDGWKSPPLPPRVALVGQYCRLEPLDADRHANDLFAANALDVEGRNWTYLFYGPFAGFEQYQSWLRDVAARSDPLFFAIVDLASEKAVGVAAYLRIDPANGSIEVGHLNFSPLLQRTRAATEAMYLMMKQAFELGYRRYEWKCDALNVPSRRAAQRLGLSYEGLFRQAVVVKGRSRDTAWYAAIDSEWADLKNAFQQWLQPTNFGDDGRQKVSLSELTLPLLKAQG